MGAGIRPERPKTITTKLRENLAALREQGASREDLQREIDRAAAALRAVSAAERRLSPVENVAAMGSSLASGASFGLFDEAMGLVGGQGAKDTQRYLLDQFRGEDPAGAFATEVMGSVAMPLSFFKQAPRAAKAGRKILQTLKEGAAQGAAAGTGNAEGGFGQRIDEALKAGATGSVTAGALGGTVRAGSRIVGRAGEAIGLTTPTIERVADRVTDPDLAAARARMDALVARRLGHETTVADVLPQGEGALRQAATSNRAVRKQVDTELRSRMNRLSNEGDDRFSEYTGTQPQSGRKTVEELNAEAGRRARPHYEAAADEAAYRGPGVPEPRLTPAQRAELAAQGVPAEKLPPLDAIDEALQLPYIQQRIGQLRAAPRSTFKDLPDDDHRMLDQVYKDIGKQIRSLPREQWALKDDLVQQRAILSEALTMRSPSYTKALSEFADPMGRRDAYELGSQRAPADIIPSEMRGMDPAEQAMFREGKAQLLRRDVPNLDIGPMARFNDVLAPIATREKAQVFKATFGEQAYKEYVQDLLEMAGLQRMKAGAGESTTVDKMMEQLQAEPEAIVGMVQSVLSGNPLQAIASMGGSNRVGRAVDRLRNSASAQANADFLLQRGDDKVRAALDLIEKLRAEGRLPKRPDFRKPNPTAASARIAGSLTGRS